jgi:hypothetical protein
MAERQMHDHIHSCRPAAQAVEIRKVAAMHLGTHSLQLLHAGITARKTAHLVPNLDQFLYQLGPDESRRSRYEYTHCHSSYCWWREPVKAASKWTSDPFAD